MSIQIEPLSAEGVQHQDFSVLLIRSRYRGISALSSSDHERIFSADISAALAAGGIALAAFSGGQLLALGAVAPLAWDSRHFGLPMANLMVAAVPGCTGAVWQVLLAHLLTFTQERLGIGHVSAEVDMDDYEGLNALLALGFEVMDVKRAYRWQDMAAVPVPKFRSRVREYRPEDRQRLLALVAGAEIGSRFSRDPQLARDKVRALYRLWFESLLDGSGSPDVLALVFERTGQVEACGVIGVVDLAPAGVPFRFMDKGLYVSGAQGVGGYFPVLYELASRALQRYPLAQTSVSLNNRAAVRVLDKMQAGSESIRYALRFCRR